MFFKSKPRNRRFERDHVLEVKMRSNAKKPAQVRTMAVALSAGCLTLLILFVTWRGGEWLLNRLIYENQNFAIREVEAVTDGVIAPDFLKKWSRVKPGQNILALDLSVVKRDLETVPWIESAAVERQLPNRLKLRVRERLPIAQVYGIRPKPRGPGYDAVIYHLDAAGFVMEPLNENFRLVPPGGEAFLPLITGGPSQSLRPFRQAGLPQLQAALKLIEEFDYSTMAGLAGLKKIDLNVPEILQITTEEGSEVVFSIYNLEVQLRRWRATYEFGRKNGKAIAYLDLSIANNIPARWMDLAATPVPQPKSNKTLRARKRNV